MRKRGEGTPNETKLEELCRLQIQNCCLPRGFYFSRNPVLTRTFEKCEIQEVEYDTIFLKISCKEEMPVGWIIIVVIAYLPIIYRIHKRLDYLEKEVKRLNGESEHF
jgi:hypothetical protein